MNNYYRELKNELLAKRGQLRSLTLQSKVQGDYHEALIREFISRFIDDKLSVKTGLIYNEEYKRSRECDVIVYEKGKKTLFESGTMKGCLPEGTYIKTVEGFKDITKIDIGEEVFTYTKDGLVAQKVKRVIDSGVKRLYELKTRNRNVKASANHPFLTLAYNGKDRKSGYNSEKKHPFSYLENDYSLEWKALGNINEGDVVVVYSGGVEQETNISEVSVNLMKVLGCYLGDGSNTLRKNRIRGGRIYLHLHDEKLIQKYSNLLTEEGIGNTTNSKVVTVCRNEEYYKLTALGFKGNAHTKAIPDWVYSLSREHREALIEGLIDSDGYKTKYGFGIHLCNKKLIEQIRNLCIDLGYRVGNVRYKLQKDSYLNDRVIKGGDSWAISFYPNASRNNNELRFGYNGQKKRVNMDLPEGFEFQTISSITELDKENTYDLEVENSHTFIADGIVVHNSNEPVARAF